jgi:hypothetical protein
VNQLIEIERDILAGELVQRDLADTFGRSSGAD